MLCYGNADDHAQHRRRVDGEGPATEGLPVGGGVAGSLKIRKRGHQRRHERGNDAEVPDLADGGVDHFSTSE